MLGFGLGWAGLGLAQNSSQTPVRTPLPLTVDRDPAPSPDPDAAPTATTPGAPGKNTGDVNKAGDGRYTLSADAFEVRLDASVIDDRGTNDPDAAGKRLPRV